MNILHIFWTYHQTALTFMPSFFYQHQYTLSRIVAFQELENYCSFLLSLVFFGVCLGRGGGDGLGGGVDGLVLKYLESCGGVDGLGGLYDGGGDGLFF
ncbi:hypothetical protein ACFL1N_06380 [Thermodesulfobacteriota bacterium]